MKTFLTREPEEAAEFIKRGGIVAFPTETVYGLGADIFDERAIAKIFEAKRRPTDNPLIAHISSIGQIESLTAEICGNARKLFDAFFPGPLTLVLKKTAAVPVIATAGLNTIGVRMPANELARRFLTVCGVPVAAPSANISGRPSPTTWDAVFEDLDGRINCILQGDATEIGLESTVVDCTAETPVILRSGSITLEQLRQIVPEIQVYQTGDNDAVRSPGMKHRHYSPVAKIVLVDTDSQSPKADAFIGLNTRYGPFRLVKICSTVEEYARELFEFFRECDRQGIEKIACETVPETGIGAALMDRLRRAAA